MAWIEFHQALPRHPKTIRVARTLGIPRAQVCGHLAMLWCWALDACPDGGPLSSIDVITGAEWAGRKDFPAALLDASFLDERPSGLFLHDWDEYTQRLRDNRDRRRDANRDSQRRRRTRLAARASAAMSALDVLTNDDGHDDGHRDIADNQHPTEPNRTEPYSTHTTRAREPGEALVAGQTRAAPISALIALHDHYNAVLLGPRDQDAVTVLAEHLTEEDVHEAAIRTAAADDPGWPLARAILGRAAAARRDGRDPWPERAANRPRTAGGQSNNGASRPGGMAGGGARGMAARTPTEYDNDF